MLIAGAQKTKGVLVGERAVKNFKFSGLILPAKFMNELFSSLLVDLEGLIKEHFGKR